MPNDGNEVQLKFALDEKRPQFEVKMKLVNGRYPFQWFRIVENLSDASMLEMISWARYIAFEDEPTHLSLARNDKINEVKKKRELQKQNDSEEDSDDMLDLAEVFKGHNVKPFN